MLSRFSNILILSVSMLLLSGCNPIQNQEEEKEPRDEVIGTFFVESRNLTVRVHDITYLYKTVNYCTGAVSVEHTYYEKLPEGIKDIVKSYAIEGQTQVYWMKWKGDTVYHLINSLYDEWNGVFKPSGDRIYFESFPDYLKFLNEVKEVKCLLLTDVEVVKNADGAPNLLVGTWQTDWEHLHHNLSAGNGIDEQIALYADLPFTLSEVCHFEADGTGYLRTVKTFRNGDQEVSLDPFTYQLTDYMTQGKYQGYYYLCSFAAGDTIEYLARSRGNFEHVFDRFFSFFSYPWYKKESDPFADKSGNPKYGNPGKDNTSTIVGRWMAESMSSAAAYGIHQYTWVFRNDGTGYLLEGRLHSYSFVYTVQGEGDSLQLTVYKYDTGFYSDDGFWDQDDMSYTFVSEPVPAGKTLKAKIYDNGDSLELQGWNEFAADLTQTPVVFKRQ